MLHRALRHNLDDICGPERWNGAEGGVSRCPEQRGGADERRLEEILLRGYQTDFWLRSATLLNTKYCSVCFCSQVFKEKNKKVSFNPSGTWRSCCQLILWVNERQIAGADLSPACKCFHFSTYLKLRFLPPVFVQRKDCAFGWNMVWIKQQIYWTANANRFPLRALVFICKRCFENCLKNLLCVIVVTMHVSCPPARGTSNCCAYRIDLKSTVCSSPFMSITTLACQRDHTSNGNVPANVSWRGIKRNSSFCRLASVAIPNQVALYLAILSYFQDRTTSIYSSFQSVVM